MAEALDVRPETLTRWKKIPRFLNEIERVQEEERALMRHKFTHLLEASVNALWAELHNHDLTEKRLQTALSVLKLIGVERITVPEQLETVQNSPESQLHSSPGKAE